LTEQYSINPPLANFFYCILKFWQFREIFLRERRQADGAPVIILDTMPVSTYIDAEPNCSLFQMRPQRFFTEKRDSPALPLPRETT
jgi:hypothetical protein